ncbi:hypothetical protein Pst134EA_029428 [Puccinia striiformis f. sp. tritici]|uniref:hypothetical protein n=1 Tax=Puccinia striiformis f. sp. tritici TaxID=168172 RepID=UPI0020083BAD|nr:hypothetical protein Pst134EA_029428 [Puccinia striiformis f. sp. tritici]KAH9441418.1 hypothetical protein Pst134EB_030083 [Puccinia striiformis f. sp. tritici]KAH9447388.1 hypothetical protein Pst134EA_029428 [Puccinia striiformis f. sp. tritici]
MSFQNSQGLDSDLLIFNTDEVDSLTHPLSDTALEHNEMTFEEFGDFHPEQELYHSKTTEDDFCAVLKTTKRKVSPELMGELQRDQLKPSCSTEQEEEDVVDGLLADLQRSHTPTRVPSSQASSDGSSLEPLSEAFEVPVPLSPPVASRNLSSQRDSRRHSHSFSKPVLKSEVSQRLRLNHTMAAPRQSSRSHKRAKSETPSGLNSPTEERKHWTTDDHNLPGHFSHFHLEGACQPHLPLSTPPSPMRAPISLNSPLIADVNVAKSRVLVTKTHCFYPDKSTLIPFSSCLLGFQLVFHASDPKARIKHSQIKLTTLSSEGSSSGDTPIIKAIYPSQGTIHKTGDQTLVRRTDENSIGVKLGVDPYGAMILSHTQSRTQERYTAPYLLGSGIETNKLLITMNEDSSLHAGVPPSLAFAILLYLPSDSTKSFEADLTIETSVRNEIGASIRKMWASPKVWRLNYDGKTELGCLKMHL